MSHSSTAAILQRCSRLKCRLLWYSSATDMRPLDFSPMLRAKSSCETPLSFLILATLAPTVLYSFSAEKLSMSKFFKPNSTIYSKFLLSLVWLHSFNKLLWLPAGDLNGKKIIDSGFRYAYFAWLRACCLPAQTYRLQ